ncbi:VOC family protein [Arthrobacter cheniae]|uniref:VOC family protein n=1 Tax=Arthrobacter cheniae TaxID=1258888 RepID=A0A3A5MB28_9MICC|nr:VOC family protein [Arthrobacter cheniae]RJT79902.1 VOC family protein [Arthrobacter cheniae]
MLRVRPLIHTSDIYGSARFLQALGLHPAKDPAPGASSAVFDAGSGRVALRSCAPGSVEEGRTALAFDVADVRGFARRTTEAGTAVELSEEDHGPAARVTSPDGMSLLAGAGPRETGAPPSALAVLALWYTPDVEAAAGVLKDMGAKPRISSDAGTSHHFKAKNGGVVATHVGEVVATELAFEYDGDVRDLVPALTAGGFEPVVVDRNCGLSLRVGAPWGADVRVDEWRQDVHGPAVR